MLKQSAFWIQSHSPTFESVPVSRMYISEIAGCTFTTLIAEPTVLLTSSKLWKSTVEPDSYRWSTVWFLKELHISLTFPWPFLIDILLIQSPSSIKQNKNTNLFPCVVGKLKEKQYWWGVSLPLFKKNSILQTSQLAWAFNKTILMSQENNSLAIALSIWGRMLVIKFIDQVIQT